LSLAVAAVSLQPSLFSIQNPDAELEPLLEAGTTVGAPTHVEPLPETNTTVHALSLEPRLKEIDSDRGPAHVTDARALAPLLEVVSTVDAEHGFVAGDERIPSAPAPLHAVIVAPQSFACSLPAPEHSCRTTFPSVDCAIAEDAVDPQATENDIFAASVKPSLTLQQAAPPTAQLEALLESFIQSRADERDVLADAERTVRLEVATTFGPAYARELVECIYSGCTDSLPNLALEVTLPRTGLNSRTSTALVQLQTGLHTFAQAYTADVVAELETVAADKVGIATEEKVVALTAQFHKLIAEIAAHSLDLPVLEVVSSSSHAICGEVGGGRAATFAAKKGAVGGSYAPDTHINIDDIVQTVPITVLPTLETSAASPLVHIRTPPFHIKLDPAWAKEANKPYAYNATRMQEMGFADFSQNHALLAAAKGDISYAIELLGQHAALEADDALHGVDGASAMMQIDADDAADANRRDEIATELSILSNIDAMLVACTSGCALSGAPVIATNDSGTIQTNSWTVLITWVTTELRHFVNGYIQSHQSQHPICRLEEKAKQSDADDALFAQTEMEGLLTAGELTADDDAKLDARDMASGIAASWEAAIRANTMQTTQVKRSIARAVAAKATISETVPAIISQIVSQTKLCTAAIGTTERDHATVEKALAAAKTDHVQARNILSTLEAAYAQARVNEQTVLDAIIQQGGDDGGVGVLLAEANIHSAQQTKDIVLISKLCAQHDEKSSRLLRIVADADTYSDHLMEKKELLNCSCTVLTTLQYVTATVSDLVGNAYEARIAVQQSLLSTLEDEAYTYMGKWIKLMYQHYISPATAKVAVCSHAHAATGKQLQLAYIMCGVCDAGTRQRIVALKAEQKCLATALTEAKLHLSKVDARLTAFVRENDYVEVCEQVKQDDARINAYYDAEEEMHRIHRILSPQESTQHSLPAAVM
jgi:hypothetical protein